MHYRGFRTDGIYVGGSAPRGCTEDEGMAPRSRLAGAGSKTPQAAVVKSHGGER